jgi:hypothetical protein
MIAACAWPSGWLPLDTIIVQGGINTARIEAAWDRPAGCLSVFPYGRMVSEVVECRWLQIGGWRFESLDVTSSDAARAAFDGMDGFLAEGRIAEAADQLSFILMFRAEGRSHAEIAAAFLEAATEACYSRRVELSPGLTAPDIVPLFEADRAFALMGMERWYIDLPLQGAYAGSSFAGYLPPRDLLELVGRLKYAAGESFEEGLFIELQEVQAALGEACEAP